jgi:hypothetical protein
MMIKLGRAPGPNMTRANRYTYNLLVRHIYANGGRLAMTTLEQLCSNHTPGDKARRPEHFATYCLNRGWLVPA